VKILVAVKRVTDPEAKIKIRPDGKGIVTEGVNYVVNPFDEIAVEEALRIKERLGGEVIVVSLGPAEVTQQIRSGLAMGADRGVLVEAKDEELDPDVVARVLAKLFEREKPDLVMMGKQSPEGDENQVGQLLAEYLGLGQACFASEVKLTDDQKKARVTREVDGGLEVVEVELPAIITADLRLNEPRYASLPGIMKAKRKPIEQLTLSALGVSGELKQETVTLSLPPARKGGQKVGSVQELLQKLRSDAKVL
jgi:electron transfer flavoprotein beta subunit